MSKEEDAVPIVGTQKSQTHKLITNECFGEQFLYKISIFSKIPSTDLNM